MATKLEIDRRAMEVEALWRQGMTGDEIARFMGISRRTLTNYKKRARQLLSLFARNLDAAEWQGKILDGLIASWRHAEAKAKVTEGAIAVGWANVAKDSLKEIKKMMQEMGAIFKMPEVTEEGIPFDHPEDRRDYLDLRARALKRRKEGKGDS